MPAHYYRVIHLRDATVRCGHTHLDLDDATACHQEQYNPAEWIIEETYDLNHANPAQDSRSAESPL